MKFEFRKNELSSRWYFSYFSCLYIRVTDKRYLKHLVCQPWNTIDRKSNSANQERHSRMYVCERTRGDHPECPGVLHKLTAFVGMRAGIRRLVNSRLSLSAFPSPPSISPSSSVPLESPTRKRIETSATKRCSAARIRRSLCRISECLVMYSL